MKKIIYLLLTLSMFGLNSCSDMLDVVPQDKVTDLLYWKGKEDFKLVANGFYNQLTGMGRYDVDADIVTLWAKNTESNGSYVAPEESAAWNDRYKALRTVNYLLKQAEEYAIPEEIVQYKAEAHFFRAYLYYGLLTTYGGVPIVKVPLDINSPELMTPRNTREEVVAFILEDLSFASANLPLESNISSAEKGRVSKGAAQAFRARVALFEATWKKFRGEEADELFDIAIQESKNVIESNQYKLFTLLADSSYKYLFILENQKSNPGNFTKKDNKEYILARKYEFGVKMYWMSHSLMQDYLPTRKMADMYLTTNGLPIDHPNNDEFLGKQKSIDEYFNRDLRMLNTFRVHGKRYYCYGSMARDYANPDAVGLGVQVTTPGGGYNVHKFMTERNVGSSEEGADFPIIRLPEVLLTYAEALYEKNGSISDDDLNKSINILRQRGNVRPLSNAFVGTHGLDMRKEIRRERSVELFMEGYRLTDLKRWKTAVEELKQPITTIKYVGTEVEENYPDENNVYMKDSEGYIVLELASKRLFADKHYLQPLPLKQLFLNPNLKQNPGW